jgi:hypothetical protein
MWISNKVILEIDGVSYLGNELNMNWNHFQLYPSREVMDKYKFSNLMYDSKTKDLGNSHMIEYKCKAQDSNGHIKEFMLRIENGRGNITVKKGSRL